MKRMNKEKKKKLRIVQYLLHTEKRENNPFTYTTFNICLLRASCVLGSNKCGFSIEDEGHRSCNNESNLMKITQNRKSKMISWNFSKFEIRKWSPEPTVFASVVGQSGLDIDLPVHTNATSTFGPIKYRCPFTPLPTFISITLVSWVCKSCIHCHYAYKIGRKKK